ncbi:HalOD1 output domain-containing protein [Natrarchaeobaculum sulfurireducens]|uniref:Halobacterial output domain-containing protein n=1 Tax=Natrarchaeobaculum sulfurireducens TaxID=2044521 RepID=A0A346PQI8_9EURY|nr:HalOD1 output domain-containing protein [Natrarchaeobaculum sulfurireducens]AXR78200.1 hypothetical protein AArc1_1878 [Natrarchaeobaculum sulfurireducens]AXR81783.1 hypothetical protein AArcMg_1775 [Natrarchaeobaculum sulfurireducens]
MIEYEFSENKTATAAIIDTVAAVTGTRPTELPPLYDAVDPEALDSLFESFEQRSSETLRVEFSYHGMTVVVRDGLEVSIRTE